MEIITKLEDRFRLLRIAEVRGKTLLDIGTDPLAVIAARDFDCRVTKKKARQCQSHSVYSAPLHNSA